MCRRRGPRMPARPIPTRGAGVEWVAQWQRRGHAFGEVNLRSPDPNAMLTIEDLSGTRKAVGVGSIKGSLPVGSYTAVLADPSGIDPRIPLDVTAGAVSELVLEPADRLDGFRADPTGALRWSSPAAQLAAVTRSIWANGHRAFLLVGGSAAVDPPAREIAGYPQRFERAGRLLPDERGWWVALPVRGPWRSVQLGGHRITVPAAPDSVSAVAFTAGATTVALFDTTHAEPAEIAAQDRVQEYLATGRLGAADLTSRFAVEAGQRWPWGAAAAIRRLIDRTRLARTAPQSPRDDRAVVDDGGGRRAAATVRGRRAAGPTSPAARSRALGGLAGLALTNPHRPAGVALLFRRPRRPSDVAWSRAGWRSAVTAGSPPGCPGGQW